MRAPRPAASNLPRPLVPRPLDVMPDPETHQTMLQEHLVYAVVHSCNTYGLVLKRSSDVPTPFSCSLSLEIVAALPEMQLPSANFAETCVRRVISQKALRWLRTSAAPLPYICFSQLHSQHSRKLKNKNHFTTRSMLTVFSFYKDLKMHHLENTVEW